MVMIIYSPNILYYFLPETNKGAMNQACMNRFQVIMVDDIRFAKSLIRASNTKAVCCYSSWINV